MGPGRRRRGAGQRGGDRLHQRAEIADAARVHLPPETVALGHDPAFAQEWASKVLRLAWAVAPPTVGETLAREVRARAVHG